MRLIVARKPFAAALDAARGAIEARNTVPIIATVLVAAAGGRMTLTSTDLDLTIRSSLALASASDAGPAAFCVAATAISDFVKRLPDNAEIGLAPSATNVTITSGRARLVLPVLPAGDFPNMTDGAYDAEFMVDSAEFKALLADTRVAHSTEETRYYLNGVYLHARKFDEVMRLVAVAADGHRMVRRMLEAPAGSETMPGIIVPTKSVDRLIRMMANHDTATVSVSETRIRVVAGDETLTTKLIDGTFPDYQRVIPTGNDKIAILPRAQTIAAAERVAVAIPAKEDRGIRFTFADGMARLEIRTGDGIEASDEVTVSEARDLPDDFAIRFNGAYVAGLLGVFPGDRVEWRMAEAGAPLLILPSGAGDAADRLAILMPMLV